MSTISTRGEYDIRFYTLLRLIPCIYIYILSSTHEPISGTKNYFFYFSVNVLFCQICRYSASSLWLFVPRRFAPAVRLSQRLRRADGSLSLVLFLALGIHWRLSTLF